jgi:thymidylate synthase|tara:strand:+ start:598 stop:1275 length:678 start_codon:yes stop_codon:yes gene_type:complete
MKTANDIRADLIDKYLSEDYVIDKSGAKTIEVLGESFVADENWLIRTPAYKYIERELDWYLSESLYVDDIPGETPQIWKDISSDEGKINSNYGWCIYSEENGNQYKHVLRELKTNPNSRRAAMIYNRPSMHLDFNRDGMSDFMCTFANTFMIRDGKLISHYVMRSNDAVFGYNNDVAWAKFVQGQLAYDLGVEVGELIWTATNLHVYERHFGFIEDLVRDQHKVV